MGLVKVERLEFDRLPPVSLQHAARCVLDCLAITLECRDQIVRRRTCIAEVAVQGVD